MLTMATVKQATKCSGGGKNMKYRATPWEGHPAGAFYCQVCGGAFDLGPRAPSHEIQEPHPLSWVHEFRQQLASTASLPEGHRYYKDTGPFTIGERTLFDGAHDEHGHKTINTTRWSLLGPLDPNREDQDDYTQPRTSNYYQSKGALVSAVEQGLEPSRQSKTSSVGPNPGQECSCCGQTRDAWGYVGTCGKCGQPLDHIDTVEMAHADGTVGCNVCATDEDY